MTEPYRQYVRCDLCDADDAEPIVEKDGTFYVRCRQCAFVYANPRIIEPAEGNRQAFESIGNKADVKAAEIIPLLEQSAVTVVSVDRFLEPDNIRQIIGQGDIVLLCVDNHETRNLVSKHCATTSRSRPMSIDLGKSDFFVQVNGGLVISFDV